MGRRLSIKWRKSQGLTGVKGDEEEEVEEQLLEPVPGLPGALPQPPEELSSNFFNLGGAHPPMPPMHPGPGPMRHGMPPRGPPMMTTGMRLPPPPPGMMPLRPPPGVMPRGQVPQVHYPSQDPNRMGAQQNR